MELLSLSRAMKPKLGIIAGGGLLPRLVAETCIKEKRPYHIFGIKDHADPNELKGHPLDWCRLGAAGKAINLMHRHQIKEIVMTGPVRRPSLAAIRPDAKALKVLMQAGSRAFGDDGILSAVIDVIESEGVKVVGVETILPCLKPSEGVLGIHRPNQELKCDIERGQKILAALSPFDIGQSIIIQQGMVLGIEAAEGTDMLIKRSGLLRRDGIGGVLVKLPKIGQDERVDLPTIGTKTVELANFAGLSGIALQAGGALLVELAETVSFADKAGLFLVALPKNL